MLVFLCIEERCRSCIEKALDFEDEGQARKGRLNELTHVEDESVKIGLKSDDELCRSKWSVSINQIAAWLR